MTTGRISLLCAILVVVLIFGVLIYFYRKKNKKLWMKVVMGICTCALCAGMYFSYNLYSFLKDYKESVSIEVTKIMDMVRDDKEDEIEVLQENGILITGCNFGGVINTENGERYYFHSGDDKIIVQPKNEEVLKKMQNIIVRPRKEKYGLYGLIIESDEDDNNGKVTLNMFVNSIE